jgi:hypothetical protein
MAMAAAPAAASPHELIQDLVQVAVEGAAFRHHSQILAQPLVDLTAYLAEVVDEEINAHDKLHSGAVVPGARCSPGPSTRR